MLIKAISRISDSDKANRKNFLLVAVTANFDFKNFLRKSVISFRKLNRPDGICTARSETKRSYGSSLDPKYLAILSNSEKLPYRNPLLSLVACLR